MYLEASVDTLCTGGFLDSPRFGGLALINCSSCVRCGAATGSGGGGVLGLRGMVPGASMVSCPFCGLFLRAVEPPRVTRPYSVLGGSWLYRMPLSLHLWVLSYLLAFFADCFVVV